MVILFITAQHFKSQNVLHLDKLWGIHTMKYHKKKKEKNLLDMELDA